MRMARKIGSLTTKTARKGYYKGTRTGSMGSHTKHGGYKLDVRKVRTYVVPDALDEFRLTPFVTNMVKANRGEFWSIEPGMTPGSGKYYLHKWRQAIENEEEGSGQ